MALPSVRVEFDANPPQPGEFKLDTSALDGGDALAATPRWVNVTVNDLPLSGSIVRGRQNVDSPVQAGQLTLVCDNFSGNFDPDNPNSLFNQDTQPYLIKGMPCRVSAAGFVLFVGRLESATLDSGLSPQATLTFTDDLTVAGSTAMASFNAAIRAETSLSRVNWLVSQLTSLYDVASVSSNLARSLLPTYGGGSVLDMLNTVAAAEQGRVFCSRANVLTVTAHADDLTGTVVATLTDDGTGIDYEALQRSSARLQVVNGSIVDRYNRNDSNYPSQYGSDPASVSLYGQTVVDVIAPLLNDSDAQALAAYLATRRSRPVPQVDAVQVNFSGQAPTALLTADLGQLLLVHRTIPYTSGSLSIDLTASLEGIRWDFSAGTAGTPGSFLGTFYLSPSDITTLYGGAGAFTLDTSSLDGPDLLAAY